MRNEHFDHEENEKDLKLDPGNHTAQAQTEYNRRYGNRENYRDANK